MTQISSRYLSGMREFHAFHELLYACLRKSLPEATLSKSGAYRWRGYRIDAYETLARGHYYFLTYPDDPKHLLLEEAYFDSRSVYHRPFVLRLNLQDARLFLLDLAEQRSFLSEFIVRASRQALIWQASRGRTTVVAPDMLDGREVHQYARMRPTELRQINKDYLVSTKLQTRLFEMLKGAIQSATKHMPAPLSNGVYFEANAHPHNWAYRGQRMKPKKADGSVPQGPFPCRWNIYYDTPGVICLEKYDGIHAKPFDRLDLVQVGFFDLGESEQQKVLERFALQALGRMGQEATL
jgi:hypothetical protein